MAILQHSNTPEAKDCFVGTNVIEQLFGLWLEKHWQPILTLTNLIHLSDVEGFNAQFSHRSSKMLGFVLSVTKAPEAV